jgi:putative transposase
VRAQHPEHDVPLPKGWPRRVRSAAIHAVSLANVVFAVTRSQAENHFNARVRLQAENDRLRSEIAVLREELRIKDARMERIPAQRRPHYPPIDRLAILELRAARAWSLAETARRLLVMPLTIASWMHRLDDEGPEALVRLSEPVNRFPEFVGYFVRRLKTLCPAMGTRRIARVLCRAGLHLGTTTVRRMLTDTNARRRPKRVVAESGPVIRAKRPNDVWHTDLTTVPIVGGFWVPWLPWALTQRWPFCWWIAVVVDHYSRRVMGVVTFRSQPSSAAVQRFLDRVTCETGVAPRHLITDKGRQFIAVRFRRWCRRRGIRQRFGAVGKYGSIAVVERFIRTMKNECTRRILVPLRLAAFQRELSMFAEWYNGDRPHEALRTRTPDEIYFGRRPACLFPRFEPRAGWPRRSPCAKPSVLVRGHPGAVVELDLGFHAGRKHLPLVSLKRVA